MAVGGFDEHFRLGGVSPEVEAEEIAAELTHVENRQCTVVVQHLRAPLFYMLNVTLVRFAAALPNGENAVGEVRDHL